MDYKHLTFMSLGSNLGDRYKNLDQARILLGEKVGKVLHLSGIYESGAWGYDSTNHFLNCCVSLTTDLEAGEVLHCILDIEKMLGRVRSRGGYRDRIIDIDLLFYDDLVINYEGLSIPHPRIAERRFVLLPLAEIAGDLVHPVSGNTISDLLAACRDPSDVRPV